MPPSGTPAATTGGCGLNGALLLLVGIAVAEGAATKSVVLLLKMPNLSPKRSGVSARADVKRSAAVDVEDTVALVRMALSWSPLDPKVGTTSRAKTVLVMGKLVDTSFLVRNAPLSASPRLVIVLEGIRSAVAAWDVTVLIIPIGRAGTSNAIEAVLGEEPARFSTVSAVLLKAADSGPEAVAIGGTVVEAAISLGLTVF